MSTGGLNQGDVSPCTLEVEFHLPIATELGLGRFWFSRFANQQFLLSWASKWIGSSQGIDSSLRSLLFSCKLNHRLWSWGNMLMRSWTENRGKKSSTRDTDLSFGRCDQNLTIAQPSFQVSISTRWGGGEWHCFLFFRYLRVGLDSRLSWKNPPRWRRANKKGKNWLFYESISLIIERPRILGLSTWYTNLIIARVLKPKMAEKNQFYFKFWLKRFKF